MTRVQHIEHAIIAALNRHEASLNAAVGVSTLHIDVKFDKSSGLANKAILKLEMENFLTSMRKGFTFQETQDTIQKSGL